MSGQYVHNHGIYGLVEAQVEKGLLPDELSSYFQVFKGNDYRTGIVGHVHVEPKWIEPYCDQFPNMNWPDNPYNAYLKGKGLLDKRDDEAHASKSQHLDGYPSELSSEDSYEGYCYQSFCELLAERSDGEPFFYKLDPLHPHENYIPVQRFWDIYEGVELQLPPSADEDLSDKSPHQQWMIERQRTSEAPWLLEPKTYEAVRLRKLRGYYGCISQVDYLVGLVVDKLKEIGELDNTIIIYTADHGEFALEHGFMEKVPGISDDAVTRVPYIWNWPGGDFTANTVEELVESIDTFPTLCQLAGIQPLDTMDGKDLSGMLHGQVEPLRDFVVTEFPLSRVIRTKQWKLVHRPRGMFAEKEDAGELYNLAEDRWEMNNLYDDPEYREIREELRRRYFDWLLLTTRYYNFHPMAELGADGKITTEAVQQRVQDGRVNYL